MKIQVGFPVIGNRIAEDYMEQINEGNYSRTFIKTVNCDIRVSELTDDKQDRSTLNIKYSDDYAEDSTFAEVMRNAEQFARNYCDKLGIGAN